MTNDYACLICHGEAAEHDKPGYPCKLTEADVLREHLREHATVLEVLLDQVDYTSGACRPNELIGGVLPLAVLNRAKQVVRARQTKPGECDLCKRGVPHTRDYCARHKGA